MSLGYRTRMWTAAMALMALSGCSTGPQSEAQIEASASLNQIWSTEAALTHAVRDLCLPAEAAGRPVSEFAKSPRAMSVSGPRAPSTPGDAWYVGAGVYVVDQSESRGCYITVRRGDAAALRAAAVRLMAEPPYGLSQGRSGVAGAGRMLRTSYCGAGAQPLMALMSSARPGARDTSALQLTIFPSDPSSASANCAPNGAGEGSDRDYDDG